MDRAQLSLPAIFCALVLAAGCDDVASTDAGASDAGSLADSGGASDAGADAGAASDAGSDAGTDASMAVDASPPQDAGADASAADDAGADAGVDAGPVQVDAGPLDAGPLDAGPECAPLDYGAPAVTPVRVDAPVPTPTGGAVPTGRYDLVRFETYGANPPFMRARGTWGIVSDAVMHSREAFAGGTTLPDNPVRSWSWSLGGTSLTRTATCAAPSPATRVHPYSLVSSGAGDELWLHFGSTVMVYARR